MSQEPGPDTDRVQQDELPSVRIPAAPPLPTLADEAIPPPVLHSTDEPVDVVAALGNLIRTHEDKESRHLDEKLGALHARIVGTFREEAMRISRPFLERFEEWQKREGARVDDHESRLVEVEKLKGIVENMQRELDEVKRQIAALVGDGK